MTAAPQLALIQRSAEKWLTTEQAIKATGWTDRWLRAQSSAGKIVSRASADASSNGRPSREYLAASLPIPAASRGSHLALVAPTLSLGPLFASVPAPMERIVLPDPESQAQAEKRLAALEPVLQFSDNPARYSALRLADGRPVTSLERMIEYTAAGSGQSTRTIKRWLATYRASGFSALADRVRADKGQSRWFAHHPQAAMLAAYLHLNERQSVTFVCEQIERDADRLAIETGDLPSRETVRIFLSNISPAMKTLAREGQREYRERMSPYIRRQFNDIFANQVWVGDCMIHDVEVANDLFDDAPLGAPVRLRLDAMIDFRSRKVLGATWAWFGSSRSIAATMRRAILQFGPPEMIYVDNGKDYKKVAKGAQRGFDVAPWTPDDFDGVEKTGFLARLGIGVTHCIPRHPQSKHVERFFGTLHKRFDSVHSTYTSGSPFTRPDQTEAAMMLHRRLFKKGRVNESKYMAASTFILGCLSWIEEYNATPHSGEGMDGCSPNQVFDAELNPNQKPTPEPAALALLMAEHERRQVRECAITLRNHRYTPRPEDRLAWAAMHEANEREILVAFDPVDMECAVALDLDGHFLAWLEVEQLLRFDPNGAETQKKIGESMEIRRGLEKATRNTLRTIEAAARSNGAQSAQEMLYGRLQLPAAAGPVITQRKANLKPEKQAVAPMTPAQVARMILED